MASLSRPDWVMTGFRTPTGKYRVCACRDLPSADLQVGDEATMGLITLTAVMRSVIMAEGDSYGEALEKIFRNWSADGDRPALEPGRRELPAGTGWYTADGREIAPIRIRRTGERA